MIKKVSYILIFLTLTLGLSPSLHAMGRKPKPFQVEVKVDFGPANKPAHAEKIYVEKRTTPKEAVSQERFGTNPAV